MGLLLKCNADDVVESKAKPRSFVAEYRETDGGRGPASASARLHGAQAKHSDAASASIDPPRMSVCRSLADVKMLLASRDTGLARGCGVGAHRNARMRIRAIDLSITLCGSTVRIHAYDPDEVWHQHITNICREEAFGS